MTRSIESDMAAGVWQVSVAVGDIVREGDVLMVLESMKMEIPIESPVDGTVESIAVAAGDAVVTGQELAVIS
ncbi:acetyl-CoA carboxylase biotin carboxyl carrier protein subunit [Rhodococcoides yunnanense]|uniref:acetyl-CoA carboxylase biotin carboxyl carrier protein subunit n=1 Tax=Rhodococcoides yunnanense TaxID=278209 RepID=UPI000932C9CF|nr:acetyl-CoA carboxylase biotin carboxyl carrier protein subunit [Rhodococcus yunnanensis]